MSEQETQMLFEPGVLGERDQWVMGWVACLVEVPYSARPELLQQAQRLEAIYLYHGQGWSLARVGERLGISGPWVGKMIGSLGGERRRAVRGTFGGEKTDDIEQCLRDNLPATFWEQELNPQVSLAVQFAQWLLEVPDELRPGLVQQVDDQEMALLHQDENGGWSMEDIGQRVGVSTMTVWDHLMRMGIQPRTKAKGRGSKLESHDPEVRKAMSLGLETPEAGVPDYGALEELYGLTPDLFLPEADWESRREEIACRVGAAKVRMGHGPDQDTAGNFGDHER